MHALGNRQLVGRPCGFGGFDAGGHVLGGGLQVGPVFVDGRFLFGGLGAFCRRLGFATGAGLRHCEAGRSH